MLVILGITLKYLLRLLFVTILFFVVNIVVLILFDRKQVFFAEIFLGPKRKKIVVEQMITKQRLKRRKTKIIITKHLSVNENLISERTLIVHLIVPDQKIKQSQLRIPKEHKYLALMRPRLMRTNRKNN